MLGCMSRIMMWQFASSAFSPARWHIFVLINKTKNMLFGVCHMSQFRGQKWIFWVHFFSLRLCSHFYFIITWINFVILYFYFAQESKKFQEMDINDVQKWTWRNPFQQNRALLGVLRNFFGTCIERPYMQW